MKYKKKFLIIIPVYNEKNNIKPIVEKIFKKFTKKLSILFIDDNSIDGTRQEIFNLKTKYNCNINWLKNCEDWNKNYPNVLENWRKQKKFKT